VEGDMLFEWDEEKAKINKVKHGISFETATMVFMDEERIEYYDEEHSGMEDRYITIGFAGDVLLVVYTYRDPKIRLISARIANERERKRYKDGY
jgi:putative toxin-antitoxin system, toxin component